MEWAGKRSLRAHSFTPPPPPNATPTHHYYREKVLHTQQTYSETFSVLSYGMLRLTMLASGLKAGGVRLGLFSATERAVLARLSTLEDYSRPIMRTSVPGPASKVNKLVHQWETKGP